MLNDKCNNLKINMDTIIFNYLEKLKVEMVKKNFDIRYKTVPFSI